MYAYIKGTFVSVRGDNIVVENNGIGYKIYMPMLLQGRIGHIGDEVCVYTYHYVREDVIALYGFPEPEDQDMFELLLTVSGVGPKSAIGVVEVLRPSELAMAVLQGDIKKICTVKGLGKKMAELICVSLKEQIAEDFANANIPDAISQDMSDAIFALSSLGLSQTEAVQAVQDAQMYVQGVENIIAYVLRNYKK